jgi:hypothetical protein
MNIMSFIGDVLARLHAAGFPEAIVAGGAIRDWDNGKESEIKDIDVFVKDRPMYLYDLTRAFPEPEGWQRRLMVPEHVAQYMQFEGVKVVQEFQHPGYLDGHLGLKLWVPPPVQVIVMGRDVIPEATIERHDFGICQVAYDGKAFYTSHHYDEDKANHTFTLIRCRDGKDYARSMKRWGRLSQKYTGWQLIANEVQ